MADIIFGRNPVLEALRAGRNIRRLFVEEGAREEPRIEEIISIAHSRGVIIERVARQALDVRTGHGVHQGVVALGEPRPAPTVDTLLAESVGQGKPALFVVIDGIEDPHNLGAILRTADATGVLGVVTRIHRAVGVTPAATKAAAGAAEYVPVIQVANISQTLQSLKKAGVWIVGIDSSAPQSYLDVDYRPPTAIVVGAEGEGMSPLVKKNCDFLASIPMKGKITSLNASVAAAVVLYEVVRQRGHRPASPR